MFQWIERYSIASGIICIALIAIAIASPQGIVYYEDNIYIKAGEVIALVFSIEGLLITYRKTH